MSKEIAIFLSDLFGYKIITWHCRLANAFIQSDWKLRLRIISVATIEMQHKELNDVQWSERDRENTEQVVIQQSCKNLPNKANLKVTNRIMMMNDD